MLTALGSLTSLPAHAQTDTTPPALTIDTPTLNAHFNTGSFPTWSDISGTASDAQSGVTKVDITLYRDWDGPKQYWNGTTWTSSLSVRHSVVTGSNWTLTTGWPSGTDLLNGRYTAQATATNGANLTTSISNRTFYIGNDATAPTATFTSPTANQNYLNLDPATTPLSGTISDSGDSGLATGSVHLRLTRTAATGTEYWTPGSGGVTGTWKTTDPSLNVTLGTPSNGVIPWSYSGEVPSGSNLPSVQYRLYLVANDRARNSLSINEFFGILPGDTVPPTIALTSPTFSATATGPQLSRLTQISGTADDVFDPSKTDEGVSGLAQVQVQLRRSVTVNGSPQTQIWNGSAWTTGSAYLPVSGTSNWICNSGLPTGANLPYGNYFLVFKSQDKYNNFSPTLTSYFSYGANRLPVAQAQSLSTSYGVGLDFDLQATDADSDDLTYQVTSQPAHGTLSGTAPHLSYVPASGWQGSDSFTFTASDPDGTSSPATVTITTLAPVALDAKIKLTTDTPWLGEGAWDDSTAASMALHTRTQTAYTGTSPSYQVSLTKSGGASSETVKVTMPNAASFPAGWGLHFYDSATGGTDITSQVLGDGYPVTLVNGQSTTLSFIVDVPAGAATDDQATVQVKATQVTTSETVASDKVQGVTVAKVAVQPDLSVRLLDDNEPYTPWVGETVIGLANGETKPEQKVTAVTIIGLKRSYAVQLTNNSATAGEFKLDLPAAPTGWTAQLFQNLDADHNFSGGDLITFDAQGSGPTLTVPANTTLELRLELTAGATITSNYEAKLRASCGPLMDQVSVLEQTQSIAKIQWSRDGDTWNDLPSTPLAVEQYEVIGFRAVGTDPNISWDDVPGYFPVWDSLSEGISQITKGEDTWIHFPIVGTTSIAATAGNQKNVSVEVSTQAP